MFLKTNDRIVNLKNVSNINILRGVNRDRIIFNMNYTVEIHPGKYISDYVYWDAIDADDLGLNIKYLMENKYFAENFIDQTDDKGFININEISSIKFAEKKNRVIFNLSHPVTFEDRDRKKKLTSEFVYVNCSTFEKYQTYVEYVQLELERLSWK